MYARVHHVMRRLALALVLVGPNVGCGGDAPRVTADVPASPTSTDVPAPQDLATPHDAATDAPSPADLAPLDAATDAPVDAPTDAPTDVHVDAPADAAPRTLRVLFIGNSYTYVNDLPAAVARIARESEGERGRPSITVDSAVEGGATLQLHWERMRQDRIRMGPWDAVVLQGQSVEPILAYQNFDLYARRFAERARAEGSRVVFYATWARRPGDAVYAQPWSGGNFAAMTTRLDNAYRMTAMNVMGETARVGLRWSDARAAHPTIELYDSDGSHPSAAGTFLAACVMYRALTGLAPSARVTGPAGLSADDAARLRAISERD